jgi:predicted NUDIX family NTP pyrophosphohydrolase
MPITSAGILMFRRTGAEPEVLLVHPGGPYWAKKDDGAWSIPKGVHASDEDALVAARREFEEETGCLPQGAFEPLGTFRQPSGKRVAVWAVEQDFDLADFRSNSFELEWPPRSGRSRNFPEADRAAWFTLREAERKVTKGQQPIIAALRRRFGAD